MAKDAQGDLARTKTLVVEAIAANVTRAIEFVASFASEAGCSDSIRNQLSVCVDEVFANISQYAYADGDGEMRIDATLLDEPARIQVDFRDSGPAFSPLEKEDPDVDSALDEREVGGLGIFITKNLADEVRYVRDGDYNVLSIIKRL